MSYYAIIDGELTENQIASSRGLGHLYEALEEQGFSDLSSDGYTDDVEGLEQALARIKGGSVESTAAGLLILLGDASSVEISNGMVFSEDNVELSECGANAPGGGGFQKGNSCAGGGKTTQQSQTESKAFKEWFGDSKVVDKDGNPLVVYHGSKDGFTVFDLEFAPEDEQGFWFGDSDWAGRFSLADRGEGVEGSNVIPSYLSIRSPYNFNPETHTGPRTVSEIFKVARDNGHDGVFFKGKTAEVWVAFEPNQIKSAIGNQGTFDPNNDDIRFGECGANARGGGGFQKGNTCAGGGEASGSFSAETFGDERGKKFDDWFKGSQVVDDEGNPQLVHHVTTGDFTEFDPSQATQGGIIWFTSNREKIDSGTTGAPLNPSKEKKVISGYLNIQKMAGWDEYDKLGLGQIEEMGFDGIKLDDDYIIFNPRQIKSEDSEGFDPNESDFTLSELELKPKE